MGRLKFCEFLVLFYFIFFFFRTVGFYLGRGVTWVVSFDGCGLSGLAELLCIFCTLPMFWQYLGTCNDRKEFT